ncbi:glycosyltransferase family 4 protein [Salarchaeum japonicum]|uniref:glycosyltransferase family 4 protein n=1 Tax=Salarchaeum japonicum TaxID=555573 RepID=UPI003C72968F
MKIIQVTPRYAPNSGGVETHVQEISERFVERGHDVVVLTADYSSDCPSVESQAGVKIRRHRSVAPGGAFHLAPGIVSSIRQVEGDVVHAHNYHSLPVFFTALAVRDERFVATPHYHGGSASDFRDVLISFYRPLGSFALQAADRVVAVSEWERNRLREDFGIEATIIPNGLNPDQFRNAEPYAHDRPYLLTVGRLEAYKGVQHVIRALPDLPGFDLLVAGSGPYRDELERIAIDTEVGERVEFLGYVSEEKLPRLYAGADVFVTLSEFEAYGMTVAEALAAGTPCVVREAGALTEWAENPSVIGVPEGSPLRISNAICEALHAEPHSWSPSTWDDVTTHLKRVYSASDP